MQVGQDVDLLAGQALDPRISPMSVQRHLSLDEPLAQRFRIDAEEGATFAQRKTGHEKDSFARNNGEALREIVGKIPGNSQGMQNESYPAAQRRFV